MEQPVISKDASGHLVAALDPGGHAVVRVQPLRFFPLTHPDEHWGLLLREEDGSLGKEVMSIPSPGDLDPVFRRLLEQEVNASFQVTHILKVCSIKDRGKVFNWTVETAQGRQSFDVGNDKRVNMIAEAFVLINDSESRRFLIRLDEMDPRSRAVLEMVV